jgi:polar amino acid transport system substrate-binding protein
LEDLWNIKSIGVGRGVADETFLRAKGFNNLVTLNNQKQLLQMLNTERIDVAPMGELVMPEMAKTAGIDSDNFERTTIKLYDSKVNLAFSNDVPDNIVLKWQQALDTLKASGKHQEFYQNHMK